jgi:uncharacterized membrane protein YgcG
LYFTNFKLYEIMKSTQEINKQTAMAMYAVRGGGGGIGTGGGGSGGGTGSGGDGGGGKL